MHFVCFVILLLCSSVCSGGRNMLTQEEIDSTLETHNEHRRKTGAKMLKMKWNEDLANFAEQEASKCVFKHSESRDKLGGFEYSGENIYVHSAKPTMKQVVDDWAAEIKDYHYETNDCNPNRACGHYTQVVWDKTGDVGCAMIDCKHVENFNRAGYMVFCNYGPGGNYYGVKPYETDATCAKYDAADDPGSGLCVKAGGASNSGSNTKSRQGNSGERARQNENHSPNRNQNQNDNNGQQNHNGNNRNQGGENDNRADASGDEKCEDKFQYCNDHIHTCQTAPGMKHHCAKSCGFCGGGKPVDMGCVDGYKHCSDKLNECKTDEGMKWHCAKSCGFCS